MYVIVYIYIYINIFFLLTLRDCLWNFCVQIYTELDFFPHSVDEKKKFEIYFWIREEEELFLEFLFLII